MTTATEITESDRAELVTQWSQLALGKARRFVRRGDCLADYEQEAYLGLLQASREYDPDRGEFGLFAETKIHRHLCRYRTRSDRQSSSRQWQRSPVPIECFAVPAPDPADETVSLRMIEQGLDLLSARDRELVARYYGVAGYERTTSAQLAADMGIVMKHVTRRIRQVISVMRDNLASEV